MGDWVKAGSLSRSKCMCKDAEVGMSKVHLRKGEGLHRWGFVIRQEMYKSK